jgi:hypothetical protein
MKTDFTPRVMRLFAALAIATATVACGKTEPAARVRQAAEPAAQAPAAPAVVDASFQYPAVERLVAIGDLHGDVAATRAALRLAGAIDEQGRWSGGKLVVVQTGDQLDRGDDEPEILELLDRLAVEAGAAGGALHVLNGNHEVMNVQGDFRYVTPDGFRDYGAAAVNDPRQQPRTAPGAASTEQGRAAAFLPGGSAARQLAKRPVVVQVGANVFVHGGILQQHIDYGLGRINREVQQWMQATAPKPAPAIVANDNGPIWLRLYSDGLPLRSACDELDRVLSRLSAKRLIVGHTVQQRGINSACGGKVWRIDVGLSRHYGGRLAVLEIKGDATRVLDAAALPAAAQASPSASARAAD